MSQIQLNSTSDITQIKKDREKAAFDAKTKSLEYDYDRIWTIHKKDMPLEEKRLFQRQSEEIILNLESENKINPASFEFAVELNESFKVACTTYISKFKWLLTTIEKEIKDVETKDQKNQ